MSSIIPPQVRSLRRKLVAATTTSRKSLTTFPLASYFSIHLLLSAFLLFSFGFLPRSEAFWRNENALGDGGFKQTVSADRPEHPFLTPITSDPFKTMVLEFIGVTFCMIWWSGHLRSWWSVVKSNERRAAGSASTQDSEPVVREDLARRLEVCTLLHFGRIRPQVINISLTTLRNSLQELPVWLLLQQSLLF